MNILFLQYLINIININEETYDTRYFEYNNIKQSTNILNNIIWEYFSSLFNDKSFLTINNLIHTVGIEEVELEDLFKRITSSNYIDFNNFNYFLNKIHDYDYITLLNYIPNDNLSTPDEWSSIGSDYDSDDSIINIESNIIILDTNINPISPKPTIITNNLYTDELDNSNNYINTPPKSVSKHSSIKFYDPNTIPDIKYSNKPNLYSNNTYEYSDTKYSWYINWLLYINDWFQKHIQIPNWIKNYF